MSWSLSSQESVATDEGFHDESTNDTDPLVKLKTIEIACFFYIYHPRLARNPGGKSSSETQCWRSALETLVGPAGQLA